MSSYHSVLVRVRPLRGAVPQHSAAFVGANRRGEENDRGEPQGHHPRHVFVRDSGGVQAWACCQSHGRGGRPWVGQQHGRSAVTVRPGRALRHSHAQVSYSV
ncbi:hypothetical protein C7M84_004328, partial [Penaeus vannamei]